MNAPFAFFATPLFRHLPCCVLTAGLLLVAPSLRAQTTTVNPATPPAEPEILVVHDNVREDWAQVLRVEPVYQTLHTNQVERQCNMVRVRQPNESRGLGRFVDAVRAVWRGNKQEENVQYVEECRDVLVPSEHRRPLAYDVEYSLRGVRYRSRLPFDPGNRIRLRVTITPIIPADIQQRNNL